MNKAELRTYLFWHGFRKVTEDIYLSEKDDSVRILLKKMTARVEIRNHNGEWFRYTGGYYCHIYENRLGWLRGLGFSSRARLKGLIVNIHLEPTGNPPAPQASDTASYHLEKSAQLQPQARSTAVDEAIQWVKSNAMPKNMYGASEEAFLVAGHISKEMENLIVEALQTYKETK